MSSDDELQSLRDRVDELVKKNTLFENQLRQVKKEQIEYMQNVSHQLVAPLNAIKWHIENLTEGRIGVERAQKVLRSIYSQSTIAVHLAKNFALMSNLEADHKLSALREPLQRVSLCALMVNLADDFQPFGWEKNLQIKVENEPLQSAPDVLVVKPLISQVFSNIIENAVKYSEKGSTVSIRGQHDPLNDTVCVSVANKGISLTGEERSQVFERGFRSEEAKNQYPAGTGFGLYIARRIVEIHEGQISADVDSNGRAVFSVSLTVK